MCGSLVLRELRSCSYDQRLLSNRRFQSDAHSDGGHSAAFFVEHKQDIAHNITNNETRCITKGIYDINHILQFAKTSSSTAAAKMHLAEFGGARQLNVLNVRQVARFSVS